MPHNDWLDPDIAFDDDPGDAPRDEFNAVNAVYEAQKARIVMLEVKVAELETYRDHLEHESAALALLHSNCVDARDAAEAKFLEYEGYKLNFDAAIEQRDAAEANAQSALERCAIWIGEAESQRLRANAAEAELAALRARDLESKAMLKHQQKSREAAEIRIHETSKFNFMFTVECPHCSRLFEVSHFAIEVLFNETKLGICSGCGLLITTHLTSRTVDETATP